jgi:iron complex outermembrane recepter protein
MSRLTLIALAMVIPLLVSADEVEEITLDEVDYTTWSIEDLLDVVVTTVSRKETPILDSPAAVHVITREDIRRSGHTSIPEILRLAPGLHVARINSSTWAIGARGANNNGRFADKLLVMIDGRSVYTDLFSGVWWDAQDLILEDIERIEVIRGPGGAMWGANAVNGVINIITRSAEDTQGSYATAIVGDEDRGIFGYRYGGEFGDQGFWRAYGKALSRDSFHLHGEGDSPDGWSMGRLGGRLDWSPNDRDSFTVDGGAYDGNQREIDRLVSPIPPYDATAKGTHETRGGHLLGRWSRVVSDRVHFDLQAYVDNSSRKADVFDHDHTTVDLDFQSRHQIGERHELMWGLGYRYLHTTFEGSPALDMDPHHRSDPLFSVFVQDEIALHEDDVRLILGAKLEHNEFTNFEFQPSARLLWKVTEGHSVWGALSRAVRTPSIINRGIVAPIDVTPGVPPTITMLYGSEDYDAEDLLAAEIGYRLAARDDLSLDITAFHHRYDNLQSIDPGTPFFDGTNVIMPLYMDTNREGESYGVEAAARLDVTESWRLQASLTFMRFHEKLGKSAVNGIALDGESMVPDYIVHLRSYHDLTDTLEFDFGLYAVDGLHEMRVRNYLRSDVRFAWHPTEDFEFSLVAQNVCDPGHLEFGDEPFSTAFEVERSVYFRLSWSP